MAWILILVIILLIHFCSESEKRTYKLIIQYLYLYNYL